MKDIKEFIVFGQKKFSSPDYDSGIKTHLQNKAVAKE